MLDVGVDGRGGRQPPRFLRRSLAAGAGVRRWPLGWHDLLVAKAAELRTGRQVDDLAVDGWRAQPVRHVQSQAGLGQYQGPACADQHRRARRAGGRVLAAHGQGDGQDRAGPLDGQQREGARSGDRAGADRLSRRRRRFAIRRGARSWPRERERVEADLPSFVRIGKPRITTRDVDAGVLGVRYNPFKIDEAGHSCRRTLRRGMAPSVVRRRLALAERARRAIRPRRRQPSSVAEKRQVYDRTAAAGRSARGVGVFDLVERAGRSCATRTAAPISARAACWPGGWSSRA